MSRIMAEWWEAENIDNHFLQQDIKELRALRLSVIAVLEKLHKEPDMDGVHKSLFWKYHGDYLRLQQEFSNLSHKLMQQFNNIKYFDPKALDPDHKNKHCNYEYSNEELLALLSNKVTTLTDRAIPHMAEAETIKIHWDRLQKFINDDETLKAEWNRFLMLMKLKGGDEKCDNT